MTNIYEWNISYLMTNIYLLIKTYEWNISFPQRTKWSIMVRGKQLNA